MCLPSRVLLEKSAANHGVRNFNVMYYMCPYTLYILYLDHAPAGQTSLLFCLVLRQGAQFPPYPLCMPCFGACIIVHSVGLIRIICLCIATRIASLSAIVRSHISAYMLYLQTYKLLQCVMLNAPIFQ